MALVLKKKEKNSKAIGKKSNHAGKVPQKTQTLDQRCLIQVQNLMKYEQNYLRSRNRILKRSLRRRRASPK